MAIKKGLTPVFLEVGKIKIGGKGAETTSKENKKFQLPVRYEHFVVTTTEKDKTGNYMRDPVVMAKLGDKPKEIPIRLPFDSIDLNFFTQFQFYQGKKCWCKGDGDSAIRIDAKDNESKINCDPDSCEYLTAGKCKVSGILSCYIPDSLTNGIYRFRTHSWNSVSGILAALKDISQETKGILRYRIPLKLKFLKKATADHGNVNVVTIVLDGDVTSARKEAFIEYKDREQLGINMKQIELQAKDAGFLIDTDDPADIDDEFYPETDNKPIVDADTVKPGAGVTASETADKLKDEKPKTEPKPEQGSLL